MEIQTESNVNHYDNYIDFGEIKQNSKAKTKLTFKGEITNFQIQPKCGCITTAPHKIDKETIIVDIEYKNTHILGEFEKTIVVTYKINNEKQSINLKIKGNVNGS